MPRNYRDAGGINSTGHVANRETLWATLPRKSSLIKPFPWVPMTINEISWDSRTWRIAGRGCPGSKRS